MSKLDTAWLNDATGDIHSPKGRIVWANLLEPRANRMYPERDPTFSIGALLLPKAANIDAIKTEVATVGKEVHGANWQKVPNICLKKTEDNAKLAEFAADFPFYLSSSANKDFPPFVFNPNTKQYSGDGTDIYSGRWAIVCGRAWGSKKGKGNIGWNLNRVQLLDHDEVIAGGRVATASGFEAADAGDSAPAASGKVEEKTADGIW